MLRFWSLLKGRRPSPHQSEAFLVPRLPRWAQATMPTPHAHVTIGQPSHGHCGRLPSWAFQLSCGTCRTADPGRPSGFCGSHLRSGHSLSGGAASDGGTARLGEPASDGGTARLGEPASDRGTARLGELPQMGALLILGSQPQIGALLVSGSQPQIGALLVLGQPASDQDIAHLGDPSSDQGIAHLGEPASDRGTAHLGEPASDQGTAHGRVLPSLAAVLFRSQPLYTPFPHGSQPCCLLPSSASPPFCPGGSREAAMAWPVSCVPLGTSLYLSEPQLPYLEGIPLRPSQL